MRDLADVGRSNITMSLRCSKTKGKSQYLEKKLWESQNKRQTHKLRGDARHFFLSCCEVKQREYRKDGEIEEKEKDG